MCYDRSRLQRLHITALSNIVLFPMWLAEVDNAGFMP